MIHLTFLVGQLACTIARRFIYDIRGLDFFISGLPCFIKKELNQCTLQSRAFATIYRETCAGYLHSEVKVYYIVFFCKIPMRKSVFRQIGHYSASLFDHIVGSRFSFWDHLAWDIRHRQQYFVDFIFGRLQFLVDSLIVLFQRCHFGLYGLGLILFSFFHQSTDACSELV